MASPETKPLDRSATLRAQITELSASRGYKDITTFLGNDTKTQVHKAVLRRNSGYFTEALQHCKFRHNVIKLEREEPEVVLYVLKYLYLYTMEFDFPAEDMDDICFHVNIFAAAVFYDIDTLRTSAVSKFESSFAANWKQPGFPVAVQMVYETTASYECGLRDIVATIRADNYQEIMGTDSLRTPLAYVHELENDVKTVWKGRKNREETQYDCPKSGSKTNGPDTTQIPAEPAASQRRTVPSPQYSTTSPIYSPTSPTYSRTAPVSHTAEPVATNDATVPTPKYSPTSPAYSPTAPVYCSTSPSYSPTAPVYSPTALKPPHTSTTAPFYNPTKSFYRPTVPVYSQMSPTDSPAAPSYPPTAASSSPATASYSPAEASYSPTNPRYSPTAPQYSPRTYSPWYNPTAPR